MYVADGIWKLQFTHCMFKKKVLHNYAVLNYFELSLAMKVFVILLLFNYFELLEWLYCAN